MPRGVQLLIQSSIRQHSLASPALACLIASFIRLRAASCFMLHHSAVFARFASLHLPHFAAFAIRRPRFARLSPSATRALPWTHSCGELLFFMISLREMRSLRSLMMPSAWLASLALRSDSLRSSSLRPPGAETYGFSTSLFIFFGDSSSSFASRTRPPHLFML